MFNEQGSRRLSHWPGPASPTALILCGGLGTRLRPVIGSLPKVLASVAGRPFLYHSLEWLLGEGITDIVLCTGFASDAVVAACGASSVVGVSLRYSNELEPLGTGGAVRNALELVRSDPFLVLNGDSLIEADLARFARGHAEAGAEASLLLTEVADKGRFGSVFLAPDRSILAFEEKGRAGPGLVSAGVYLLTQGVVKRIPTGRNVSIEREVFPGLIGQGLFGMVTRAPFVDIGTPESIEAAQTLFGAGS